MKTCMTCVFLSTIRLAAGIKCLATGGITTEDAPACEEYEEPKAPAEKSAEVWR